MLSFVKPFNVIVPVLVAQFVGSVFVVPVNTGVGFTQTLVVVGNDEQPLAFEVITKLYVPLAAVVTFNKDVSLE
jgi:hypothetical protein